MRTLSVVPRVVAVLWILLPQFLLSAERWVVLQSPEMELLTTGQEKEGRQVIQQLDRVRNHFSRLTDLKPLPQRHVQVVAFEKESEFKPYRAHEFGFAYYVTATDKDYLVLGRLGSETLIHASHEYVHLLAKESEAQIPLWLMEGLAELLSSVTPVGPQIRIGDLIPARSRILERSQWLTSEVFFRVSRNSPYYNERERAGLFYSQCWALTHMLVLSEEYRRGFSHLLGILAAGEEELVAFRKVYDKSSAEVQNDLQTYFRSNRLTGVLFPDNRDGEARAVEARIATALESGLVLAAVLARIGKRNEAGTLLGQLAGKHSDRWEVEQQLGYLAIQAHQTDNGKNHFARAVKLGATNAELYFDYAMLLRDTGEEPSAYVPLLRQAVDRRPDYREARYFLGFELYNQQNYREALDHLQQVRQIRPAEAFSYHMMVAFACYEAGRRNEALSYAEKAKGYAKTGKEVAAVDDLLGFLKPAGNEDNVDQQVAPRPR